MTVKGLSETPVTVTPDDPRTAESVDHDADGTPAGVSAPEGESSAAEAAAVHRDGDPRALLAARLLAALALLVIAYIHGKLALHLGLRPMLGQGQLFAAQAALSAVLAGTMLSRDNRVWLVAVVLSVGGLGAILASVYFPVPSLGPLPAIDEPVWLLNKAICALAEISVIALWLIRQIAPPKE